MREPQTAPPRLHAAFAAIGVAFLAIFSWVVLREEGAEWRAAQARFRQLEAARKNPHQLAESPRVNGIRQIWLPDLGRVDRCVTCHLGIDDPAFADAPQPFRTHPGGWLASHPAERFGCTVCHDGQGEATDYENAAHRPVAHVERPMRPLETIEANCGTCHPALDPPEAPRLAEGRHLILDSGCPSCHAIPGYEGTGFRGPALASLGYKLVPSWLEGWLRDPKSYLSRSKMGNFRLSPEEVSSLAAFLLSQRARPPLEATAVDWAKADPDAGKALFGELRCVSCHAVEGRGGTLGPELTRVGDKVRRDWLWSFLKDPHRDQPATAMLQYRLSDDQVRDLTAFLLQEYRTSAPAVDTAAAQYQDPAAVEAGRATFERRGCPSCHALAGVSAGGRIGPSLLGVADRDPEELTYGPTPVRHTTDNYLYLKVLAPDAAGQHSLMPSFGFSREEAGAITVALASIRKGDLPASRVVRRETAPPWHPAGAVGALATRYRCLSCHRVGGSGGNLSTVPLDRIGSQLQRDYLVRYLLNPGAVRVSLEARMPSFHMLPEEARMIADYAATVLVDDALDRYDARFTPPEVEQGREIYGRLGCVGCHQIGTSGGYVGPDLSETGVRLTPGWIAAWLSNPQAEKPGTIQPNYGLAAGDVRALTAYLSSVGKGRASPAAVAPALEKKGGGR